MESRGGEDKSVIGETDVPLFGARKRARELGAEVIELRGQLERVGGLELIEVEHRREEISAELEATRSQIEAERIEAKVELDRKAAAAEEKLRSDLEQLEKERRELETRLGELRGEVVTTEETVLLQEAGVYEYHHPLGDSVAYQGRLKSLQAEIKAMTRRDGGAVFGATNWEVNGSLPQGRKMVRDYSKLMLRAYNAEADNLVRALKPYKLPAAVDRLNKVVSTVARLGATMDIHISSAYHDLRIRELQLTADYRQKQAEEKERQREEKERLREERAAQKEMEREKIRLEKERAHYLNALEALQAKGDREAVARHEAELAEIERAISDVDYRAANIRAGYVYVISNIGSFGEGVVKIGLTRRLDPHERVRELGDASVPFRFDEHALLFSQDAVGIEQKLHERLADRRVNRINMRREFFYATPVEIKGHLIEVSGDLLSFEDAAEALEFRQSRNLIEQEGAVVGSESAAAQES